MTIIPDAATKRHMAILGTNGSGKTSVAKSQIVEPALAAGERVCCIDPTGVMWGVRLGANGNPKGGFPIYIVGGEHADFPLTARDGKAWAEIVGTSSDSFIFDMSLMTVKDRTMWFTDFAETLIRKNKGPLRLIEDEAHLFAPQGGAKAGGLAPDMLHAANNLLALGRSKGLRITMISQRPAKLHKDSLTQAHTLVAMKLIAPQDRNAVKDWVGDQTDAESGKDLIASLPTLKPGEGWVWAPAEEILERMQFPLPKTYDSSRAPDDDEGEGPALSPIDPAAVQARLAAVAAEAIRNDPAKLKAEIVKLRKQMTHAATAAAKVGQAPDPKAIEEAEQRGFDQGKLEGMEYGHAVGRIEGYREATEAGVSALRGLTPPDTPAVPAAVQRSRASAPTPVKRPPPVAASRQMQRPAAAPMNGTLSRPQLKVIEALAFWAALGFDRPTRVQVGVAAGYSPTSGGFANLLGGLKSVDMIDYPGSGEVSLTDEGRSHAPETDARSVRERAMSILSGPQQRILSVLLEQSETMTREEIAERTEYSPTSGGFANLLGSLRSLGLIDYPGRGAVQAAEWLFT